MDTLQQELGKLIDQIKEAYADKSISIGEALGLIYKSLAALSVLAKQVVPAIEAGDLRKFVISGAQKIYDEVIAPLDIPMIPNIIEDTVDDAIGSAVPLFIGMAYDALYSAIENARGGGAGPDDPVLILGLPKK